MTSPDLADAIIIGAGAVGCCVALKLADAGIIPHVIERDGVAANASGYAWGGLSAHFGSGVPGPMTDLYRASIAKHMELYDSFRQDASHDWELQRVTSLSLADNDVDAAQLGSDVEWMQSEGFNAELIDEDEIYRLEPAIVDGMIAASLVNAGWELDSFTYTQSIATEAKRRGASFASGQVASVQSGSGSVTGVTLTDGRSINASIVVAATGPWTSEIKGIPSLPIKPIKGEILRLARDGDDLQNRVGFNGFNVGRKPDGAVWAGTYEWDCGFDRETTKKGMDYIWNGVTAYIPSLNNAELTSSTACLRPVAVDGFPIVGPSSVCSGLFYANGAGKKGVLLSPLIADWIVGIIQNEVSPPVVVSSTRFTGI